MCLLDTLRTRTLISVLGAAVLLSACGARDGEIDSDNAAASYGANGELLTGNPTLAAATPHVYNLMVVSDANSVQTGGDAEVTISALLSDSNNVAVQGEDVSFSATGGILRIQTDTTSNTGEAVALLNLSNEFRNRDITVTAQAGDYINSVLVKVVGSAIQVDGDNTLMVGEPVDLTVTLTDGNGEPIMNREVLVSSEQGQAIEIDHERTDLNGKVYLRLPAVMADDTLSFSALDGTVTATHKLNVTTDLLQISGVQDGDELAVGSVSDVTVTWLQNGEPVVDESIRFTLTAGQLLSPQKVQTDAAGQAVVTISSSSAGPTRLGIETFNGGPQTSIDLQFVATVPHSLNLSVGSTRVPTEGTSKLSALITDNNGNPVKNQQIVFTSPDLHGGQISPSIVMTDGDGRAITQFTAGTKATEYEAVNLVARVYGTTISDTSSLTVVKRVLNVTLGTANKISTSNYDTQYSVPFVVQVADGGGAPLEDATVEVSITPVQYMKGSMAVVNERGLLWSSSDASWRPDHWAVFGYPCASEDSNGNRMLDVGEDVNNNDVLDPQDPAVLAPVEDADLDATLQGGSLKTNATGSGFFRVIYPASNAGWSGVVVTAYARALGGEAEDHFDFYLGVPSDVLNDTDNAPASVQSPYGSEPDCSSTD